MELRGCSHLHFISVIRGAAVNKIPNISREKKVLKFKDVLEIYDFNKSMCHDLLARIPQKVDRSLTGPYGSDETKIKTEFDEEEYESDCAMTLRQLQNACKSKKRKKSKSAVVIAVKREYNEVRHREEENELRETLGSFKRKLFKKRKVNRNNTTMHASSSSEDYSLLGISKHIPSGRAALGTSGKGHSPMRIKVEDAELDNSQQQIGSCILNDDPENVTSEMLGVDDPCCSKQATKATILEDSQSGCLSGTSHELLEQHIPIPVQTQCCSLNQVSYEFEEAQSRSPNQESYQHLEYVQLKNPLISEDFVPLKNPLISEDSQVENTKQFGGITAPGNQFPILPMSEPRKVEDLTDLLMCDEAPETVVMECDRSSALLVAPCIDKSIESQHLCIDPANVEFIGSSKPSGFTDDPKNSAKEIPMGTVGDCSPTVTLDKCVASTNVVAHGNSLASANEDKQLSIHDATVASSSSDIQPSDEVEVTGSASSESYQNKEVVQLPERLFSARKTISPNSQRRLCRAMYSIYLQDDKETKSCRENSASAKDCEDRLASSDVKRDQNISKGPETLMSTEITTNSRQLIRKGKDERKGLRLKGVIKGPHASHSSQQAASSCSSVHRCSQNAIKFSQQQMQDIERLASKLVTELQSMKDIVLDALHCESRAGAKLRYNTDEIRVAVENATRVEETSKKWLSIMTRDCSRFCKIMTLAEANAASPETSSPERTGQKERKKIVFADEAGGNLCHVRIFEAPEVGMGSAPLNSEITKEL